MASRKNKTGITVAGILGGLAIVLITIIVIIQTGVWATVAPQFGLPAITSISQILPGEDSMQKTNIGLGLKKPDLSKIEGQIKAFDFLRIVLVPMVQSKLERGTSSTGSRLEMEISKAVRSCVTSPKFLR